MRNALCSPNSSGSARSLVATSLICKLTLLAVLGSFVTNALGQDVAVDVRHRSLLHSGYLETVTVTNGIATARATAKLEFVLAQASRDQLCEWIVEYQRTQHASVTSGRLLDSRGNVIATCT